MSQSGSENMNRFFNVYDSTLDKIESTKLEYDRKYKYKFAIQNAKKTDTVLVINNNLLSDYLNKKVKKCVALSVLDTSNFNNIFYFKLSKFDKIFCIDVFSGLKMNTQVNLLKSFKTLLNKSGQIIITDTHPLLNIHRFVRLVDEEQFNFYDEPDYIMNYKDILVGKCIGHKYYSAILCNMNNNIKPNEFKPDMPNETK
jgi:hypothetical protein